MHRNVAWLVVAVSWLGAACACGGPTVPDAGADAGRADTLERYCAAKSAAACAREVRCGFLDPTFSSFCAARTLAECLDDGRRVAAGHAEYTPARAEACLARLEFALCVEGPFPTPPECAFHAVFRAIGGAGVGCVDGADCVDGFCFGGPTSCRTCRPFAALGEPCSSVERRCAPDAGFCGRDDAGARACEPFFADGVPCLEHGQCGSGHCNWNSLVPDAGPDACGHLAEGQRCGDPDDCIAGAFCRGHVDDGVTLAPGTCAPRAPLGDACVNGPGDDGCFAPASCLDGRCTVVAPRSRLEGAECDRLDQCTEYLYCRGLEAPQPDGGPSLGTGVCARRLSPGAACRYTTYVDTDCGPGLTCGAAATCLLRLREGEACAAASECLDFMTCSGEPRRCERYQPPGERCDTGQRCASSEDDGFCSATGRCAEPLSEGAACAPTLQGACASDRCLAPDGGSPTCHPGCLP